MKKRILAGVKQSGNIILDISGQSESTKKVVKQALKRAFGSSDKLKSVRVIGGGFNLTRKAK